MNQLPLEDEYKTVLAASMNYKRRAEAAEARAAQLEAELNAYKAALAECLKDIQTANAALYQAQNERDELRRKLEQVKP